jgi:hypothetical protein
MTPSEPNDLLDRLKMSPNVAWFMLENIQPCDELEAPEPPIREVHFRYDPKATLPEPPHAIVRAPGEDPEDWGPLPGRWVPVRDDDPRPGSTIAHVDAQGRKVKPLYDEPIGEPEPVGWQLTSAPFGHWHDPGEVREFLVAEAERRRREAAARAKRREE